MHALRWTIRDRFTIAMLMNRDRSLMAMLDRLDDFSLVTKRMITVPLLKQMLVEDGA